MYLLFIKKYYKQLLLIMCVILIIVYLLLNKIYEKFEFIGWFNGVMVADDPNLNCILGWNEWSPCPTKCNTTHAQTRTKKIIRERRNDGLGFLATYGLPCDNPRIQDRLEEPYTYTQQCPVIPCPIDCVGKFVKDSECSKSCGGGTYTEKYQITTPAQHNGIECPFEDGAVKEVECNTQMCSPIDCSGEYVDRGICVADNGSDCGPGTQQQDYKILKPLEYGGIPCPVADNTIRSISCNLKPCPINCEGSWGDYTPCTVGCGGGTKTRTYRITRAAQHEGIQCPNSNGETENIKCNTDPCPINCEGEFIDFKSCSKECGGGISQHIYNITKKAQYKGKECSHTQNELQSRPCNTGPCPTYPENTTLQEALKESNNKIQNIRYDIINRQERLDALTHKFNSLNKNISKIKLTSNYIPDDKTLTFY